MKNNRTFDVVITVVFLILVACSGQDTRVNPEEFLPESISALGMERSTDLLIFRGDSLTYYTNDAQFYQRFNFVDMATCDYSKDDIVTEIEIFRFASPEDAYGLYSHFRWSHVDDVIDLGIEGFKSPPDIFWVKGPYVAHVMGFDDSEIPAKTLDDLAEYFADDLPGETSKPEKFSLFPKDGAIPTTGIYFPSNFLGLEFMNCVYGCSYVVGVDTAFLFMACKNAAPMVLEWSKAAEEAGILEPLPEDIPYDESKGFIIAHEQYGRMVIGMKNGIMVAMMDFDDEKYGQFLADWINSLPEKAI